MSDTNNSEAIIDIPRAIQLAANKADLAKDLFQMLMDSLPDARAKIEQGSANQDREQLLHEVHRLHGATRYCGVPALQAACQGAERIIKSDDHSRLQASLESLYGEIEHLQDWAENNEWRAP